MKVTLKTIFVTLTLVVAVMLCGAGKSSAQVMYGIKTIMIDPGHGGRDPGTVFGEHKEKDINLGVALMLGEMIEKNFPDVKVLYTRKKDVFVDLGSRSEMANKAGADLFLSLHVNAVDKGKKAPSGALTLVMGTNHTDRNLDVAMRENDVIMYEEDQAKYEGYKPGSAESFIIFSLMQYAHIEQSMSFASILQKHYKSSTPFPDLGARQQGLLVLWKTTMPAVLTEMGFLPNESDRKVLTSKTGQKKVATAMFNAFSEYKSKTEGKSVALQLDVSGESKTVAAANNTPSARSGAASSSGSTASKGNIVYRIQVCVSNKQLGKNGSALKPYKGMTVTEKCFGATYKYYVGECHTYTAAAELQKKIRKTTPDAFMVAFRGDDQISVADARKETK